MKHIFFLCAVATATKPTFQLGTQIGEALSAGISDGSASADFSPAPMTNSNIASVVAAEDKKYASFAQRPLLNLHVAETHSDSLSAGSAAANAALAALESSDVARLEKIARGSFLSGDIQREGAEFVASKQAADYYTALLDAGGPAGRRGVVGLLKLASLPNAQAIMNLSTVIFKASTLAKRESTPDETRNLAGSLVTFLTGMPVAFQSSDAATGSYGHTNIYVPSPSRVYGPDAVLAQLAAGAHASYYN